MLKRLSLLCLGLMMFSVLVMAFHHHADGRDHDDCPICNASLLHQPADLAIPIHVIHPDFVKIEVITPTTDSTAKTFPTPFNRRAPPA